MRRIGLAAALTIPAYLLAALAGALWPGPHAPRDGPATISAYLVRSPIHYDILLPLNAEVRTRFAWLAETGLDPAHPGAEWLVIGWGGEAFYTTTGTYRDITLQAVWRGVTGDQGVLRIALAGPKSPDWPVRPIALAPRGLTALIDHIDDTLRIGPGTAALPLPGFSEFDRFFPAKGHFNIFRTCNVWIGTALREAGLPFGGWTPTPYAVTLAHKIHVR